VAVRDARSRLTCLPLVDRAPAHPIARSAFVVIAALALAVPAAAHAGRVGPGVVQTTIPVAGYRVALRIDPNLGGRIASTFTVRCTRGGSPVAATVTAGFSMPAMAMPPLSLRLRRVAPGVYRGTGVMLVMPGLWNIHLRISPPAGPAVDLVVADEALLDTPG
jgi:hypothetical protein